MRAERMEQGVAALGDLSRDELATRWHRVYGCAVPKTVKRGLLERAAAWHLQSNALGGLSPEGKRNLRKAVRALEQRIVDEGSRQGGEVPGIASMATVPKPAPVHQRVVASKVAMSSGTRLLREWNGRQHIVEVVEDGYLLDGKTYRSLSAVAKRITGAHWSGPRFFGL
jgi:hypothetical protein